MKFTLLVVCLTSVFSLSSYAEQQSKLTAKEIIAMAKDSEWRHVDPENILKINLPTGPAYVELNPLLAPNHTKNTKLLVREDFYDGLSMYRYVEDFVAQGGDSSEKKPTKLGKRDIAAEFYLQTKQPLQTTLLVGPDGYAEKTGFLGGFAVAQNDQQTQTWQVHCQGVFAMARSADVDSGGSEFFVTIGGPQRYLDRNITVFGRVIEGMEHFHRLNRKKRDDAVFNPISSIDVLADITSSDTSQFKVMKSDSASFLALIEERKNRVGDWYVETPDYVDVCSVPIPTERVK